MKLNKKILVVLITITSTLFSQTKEQYIFKHLIRADASIVSGYMYKDGIRNVHVNGNAEYYIDNKISVRGDATYLLGSSGLSKDSVGFRDNHSIGLGLVYHFKTKSHFDPYFIFQPSVAYTSSYKHSPKRVKISLRQQQKNQKVKKEIKQQSKSIKISENGW